MLGFRLGYSSSINLAPPTFGRSKHHLDLAQRAIINCSSDFCTDALKKADLKLRKLVKEEIKSCVIQKPQVPKDFPLEVEDIPRSPLKFYRRDEGETIDVAAYLFKNSKDDGQKPRKLIMKLQAYIEGEERLIMTWDADRDPDLCFPYNIRVKGVDVQNKELKHFDWRGALEAIGVDDSILTEFAIDYWKFRSDRKRWLTLKKLEEFIKFEFKFTDKVYATPWGDDFGPECYFDTPY